MTTELKENGVGVIGLGIIGAPVARHLQEAGYRVVVWNRTPKAFLGAVTTPAEVARQARVIHLFVSDAAAVLEVIAAMADALTPEHVLLCNATIGLQGTLDAAAAAARTGARFLDAPFTGTKGPAEKAQLLYYIGGDEAVLKEVRPVLEVSGGRGIVRIGEIGEAAVVKVATNVLSVAMVQGLAEMLGVLKAAGMPPEALEKALEHHGIRSGLCDLKLPKMLTGDFSPHFFLKHMLKDALLGRELAPGLDLPVTDGAIRALQEGMAKGWANDDFAILARHYQ